MSQIYELLKCALEAAALTKQGSKVLAGHDEDFEIEVGAACVVHVEFAKGAMKVALGPSPRREPLHFTRIQIDEESLRAVLSGKTTPVDVMEAGRMFIRTRLYGGALIPILLRSAYDLARDNALTQMAQL
jgi:hypothetical protein